MTQFKTIIDDLCLAGVKLREVSRRTGVDVGYLSRIYHGTQPLSSTVAERLAGTFGVKGAAKRALFREIRSFRGLTDLECATVGEALASVDDEE